MTNQANNPAKKTAPGRPIGKPTPPPGKKAAAKKSTAPAKATPDPAKKTATKAVAKVEPKKLPEPKKIDPKVLAHYGHIFDIRKHFDQQALKATCEAHESSFGEVYGMERVEVEQKEPSNYYFYKDNGSNILFVAHLDTVVSHADRLTNFAETAEGLVVHSGALDDRLGAYIGLELLPSLGYEFDWLLTVGEEKGQSTAAFFEPPEGKEYLWGIEFDRGNKDVVMYCYDDYATDKLVRDCGARTGRGSFSDIAYLEHLEVKMFNWGVAYEKYHTTRGYAYLEDTWDMLAYFLQFHETNENEYLPHEKKKYNPKGRSTSHYPSSSSQVPYGVWVGNVWTRYTDAERAALIAKEEGKKPATQHWTGGGNSHRSAAAGGPVGSSGSDVPKGKGGTRKTLTEEERDQEVADWWALQARDALYGDYELYEPHKNLGGHEELDEETQQILDRLTEGFEADAPFDIDPENPLGIEDPRLSSLFDDCDQDPDFVGPLPIEQRRLSSYEIGPEFGGWAGLD